MNNKNGFRKRHSTRLGAVLVLFLVLITSCLKDPDESNWVDSDNLTISQFLDKNKNEYSKFYRLLTEGKLLSTLYAYNPNGDDYTLFLPTNEAIGRFIESNPNYENFEALVKDTSFIRKLTRYHTVSGKVHSNQFPDGALNDTTLTGDRLVTGFYTDGDKQIIRVNKSASIVKSNLKMSNGFVHVISGVLQKTTISGYDWILQQQGYSILAQAIKLSGIKSRLWWGKYTILAEHDSIYHRKGIKNIDALVKLLSTPGLALTNKNNAFNLYTSYHFVGGEYYLNDFKWGSSKYATLAGNQLTINVGLEIQINPGVDTYGITISASGDTTKIDYIRPVWEKCNNVTVTGPIHEISNMLYFSPLP